jgi:hypothetical protein
MTVAWTYTSKARVSHSCDIAEADLYDEWIEWVEYLIDQRKGTTYVGVTTYNSEIYSGDDTSVIFVKHPPIVSVTELIVDGGQVGSGNFKVFDHYLELSQYPQTLISEALWSPNTFPRGVGNIELTYVGGSAIVPKNVELAATQMVSAIAMVASRQGADFNLKYSRVTENVGDAETMTERLGLQATLNSIMRAYLGPKVMLQ